MHAPSPTRLVALAALSLLGVNEAGTQSQSPVPTAGTIAAGLMPGQRMQAVERVRDGAVITAEPNRRVEGSLVDIDSAGVTLCLDDGSLRRLARSDVETLKVYRGRSHGFGLLAGWLVSIPVALIACRNARYECEAGQGIGLVGGIGGAIIEWPRWGDVRFP